MVTEPVLEPRSHAALGGGNVTRVRFPPPPPNCDLQVFSGRAGNDPVRLAERPASCQPRNLWTAVMSTRRPPPTRGCRPRSTTAAARPRARIPRSRSTVDDRVTTALNAESAADDGILRPHRVGLDQQRTIGDAGESRRAGGRRGKVCARRRGRSAAQLLVRDGEAFGLAAFDGDLLARCVAETWHRDPLARTELDLEVCARHVARMAQ